MRNYRPAFVKGTTNVRTSTFKDHAATDMHARAMTLFRKQHASHVTEYSSIAVALQRSLMDQTTWEQTKHKFDIAYTIAKETLVFTKMKSLCELEERHVVDLRQGYKNNRSCTLFVEFIARDLKEAVVESSFSFKVYSAYKLMGALTVVTSKKSSFLSYTLTLTPKMGWCTFVTRFLQ